MAITAAQKAWRKSKIGASEAAAILGLSTWATAADIYLRKTQEMDETESEPQREGRLLEPAVLQWFTEETGRPIHKSNQYRAHKNGVMACNADAFVEDTPELVEAKTCGLHGHSPDLEKFGTPYTDEVPEAYLIQATHQLAVMDSSTGIRHTTVWMPVLLGLRGFQLYRINRNDDLIALLEELLPKWWQDHVVARKPPTDCRPSLDTLKAIRRVPNKVVSVPEMAVKLFQDARAARLLAEANEEAAKAPLLMALGDAETANISGGGGSVTYFTQEKTQIDANALRVELPSVAEAFEKTITYPVLRVSKKTIHVPAPGNSGGPTLAKAAA